MHGFSSSRAFAPESIAHSRVLLVLCLVGLAFAGSGCAAFSSSDSFSESSGSVSDSVGSSSDSSGSSSGGDDSAYRTDVTQYVAAAVDQQVTPETLRRGVTEIALAHGISDWEATSATREAVDFGLADARLADRDRYRAAFTPAAVGTTGGGRDRP